MAGSVDEVISMASAVFSQDVMDAIKNAKFTMEDISHLTRDDIDQEFKKFRFGVRKQLWMFFKSLENRSSQQIPTSPQFYSHTSDSHSPIDNLQTPGRRNPFVVKEVSSNVTVGEPTDSYSSDSQERMPQDLNEYSPIPNTSMKHEASTSDSINDRFIPDCSMDENEPGFGSLESIPASYPGGVRPPFPLSAILQDEMKNINNYTENTLLFHKFVREVYLTLREEIGEAPSKSDLKETSILLCIEYPSLHGQEADSWMPLYIALRKRMNRYETGQTNLHKIFDVYTSKTVVEVLQAHSHQQTETSHPTKKTHHDLAEIKQYPGDIPWPFPLKEPMRNFLLCGNDPLDEINRKVFKELVREIAGETKTILGRRPTIKEGKQIIENLCTEFPILCVEGKAYCPPLRIAITKRYNNLDLKRKREQQGPSTSQDVPRKRSKKNNSRVSRPLKEWSWRRRSAKKPRYEYMFKPKHDVQE